MCYFVTHANTDACTKQRACFFSYYKHTQLTGLVDHLSQNVFAYASKFVSTIHILSQQDTDTMLFKRGSQLNGVKLGKALCGVQWI